MLARVGNQSTWLACFIFPDCLASHVIIISLTHLLLGIFLIMRFEAILAIAWSLSGYKELKLTTKLFIGCRLLIQTKYELSKFGHAENSYFRVSTRFLRKFLGQYYMVFASFSGPLHLSVLILVWFERSLHPAQVR